MTDRTFHRDHHAAQAIDLNAVAGLAVRPFAALAGYFRRRKALSQLSELDDHMLADVGLQRFDVADAAALPASQDVTRFLRDRVIERKEAAIRGVRRRHAPGDQRA